MSRINGTCTILFISVGENRNKKRDINVRTRKAVTFLEQTKLYYFLSRIAFLSM